MPSPVYDNKWLEDRERKRRLSITLEKPKAPPVEEMQEPDPLAAAKEFLGHSRLDPINVNDRVEADRRILGNKELARRKAEQERASKPWSAADITRPMAEAGGVANTAALGATPLALLPGGAAAPMALGALGGLLQTPDYIRRRFSPEEGEDAGVLEGLLTAANIMPGLGVGKALKAGSVADIPRPGAGSFRKTFGKSISSEIPYQASEAEIGAQIPKNLSYEGKPFEDVADRALHSGVMRDPANLHRTGTFDDISERVLGQPSNIDRTRTYGDLGERAFGGGVQVEPASSVPSTAPRGQNSAFDKFADAEPDLYDNYMAGSKGPSPAFEMGGQQFAPDEMGSHVAVKRPSLNWMQQLEGQGRMHPPTRPELTEAMPPSEDAWSALSTLKHRHEDAVPGSIDALVNTSRQSKLAAASERARAIRERTLSLRSGRPMSEAF